jgi:hypothetical protein
VLGRARSADTIPHAGRIETPPRVGPGPRMFGDPRLEYAVTRPMPLELDGVGIQGRVVDSVRTDIVSVELGHFHQDPGFKEA